LFYPRLEATLDQVWSLSHKNANKQLAI